MQKRTKLLALVDGGMPIQEAAKKLKIARSTAYEWVKRRDAAEKARTSGADPSGDPGADGDAVTAKLRAAQETAVDTLAATLTSRRSTEATRGRAARTVFELTRNLPRAEPKGERPAPIDWSLFSAEELDLWDAWEDRVRKKPVDGARLPYVLPRHPARWGLSTAEMAQLEALLGKVRLT